MQFEAVGSISMGSLLVKVGWQINNLDGLKGTFFGTNRATDAMFFRNEAGGIGVLHYNALFSLNVDRASFFAFKRALLWLAPVHGDNGNTGHCGLLLVIFSLGGHFFFLNKIFENKIEQFENEILQQTVSKAEGKKETQNLLVWLRICSYR